MWNYTRFYLAMVDFDYELSKVTVGEGNTINLNHLKNIQINVMLHVINPTDYSGFEVSSIECALDYMDGPREIIVREGRMTRVKTVYDWDLKFGSYPARNRRLAPYANETISLLFIIDSNSGSSVEQENARFFMDFLGTKPAQIEWFLTCRLVLVSFMDGSDVMRYFSYSTQMSYE
jgi:hypothetical protein